MNRKRRARISATKSEIQKLTEALKVLESEVEEIGQEEQDCLDSIPENLQNSDRYFESEDICDNLDTAVDNLSEVIELLEETETLLEI